MSIDVAPRARVAAAFLTLSLVWGSTYLAIRIALESFPPFLLASGRFLVAGAVLYVALRLRGEPRPSPGDARRAVPIGVLLCTVGNGLVVFGQQWVGSGLAAVMVATAPLWGAVVSALGGQTPTRREALALVVGLAGVVVLQGGAELGADRAIGVVAVLLAPLGWAAGSVFSQRVAERSDAGPAMRLSLQMLAGGAALALVSATLGEPIPHAVSPRAVFAAAYLVVFGSLVGLTVYMYLLRNTRPAVAMGYAYVNPVVALALGAALAGEHVGQVEVIATVLVLASVALLGVGRAAPARPARATAARLQRRPGEVESSGSRAPGRAGPRPASRPTRSRTPSSPAGAGRTSGSCPSRCAGAGRRRPAAAP